MKRFFSMVVMAMASLPLLSQSQSVDLGLSVNWASENLGATSSNPCGSRFAWGEVRARQDFSEDNYKLQYSDGGNSIEGTTFDAATKIYNKPWRMPTEDEFLELCKKCEWRWGKSNGSAGYIVTGPSGKSIFLPVDSSHQALYWSGTLSRGLGRTAIGLELSEEKYHTWGTYKFLGGFIRSVCPNPQYTSSIDAPKEWQDEKYSDLLNAIYNEDYEKAYSYATFLTSAGDTKATYLLSAMSMCGVGGPQNYENSIYSLVDLAKDGDERAQYMLGGYGSLLKQREMMRLLLGDDAEANDNAFWFQMMSVGQPSRSFKDCLEWFFTPLEEVAYKDIMYYAGVFCLNGQFGYQDEERGLMWLQNSAAMDYRDAIELLKKLQSND